MIKLTENNLLALLKEKQLDPQIEEKSKQIYILMNINNAEVPIFCGIRSDTVLQTIAYLPYELKPEAFADVARLLHLLNRDVDIPGFGMDERAKAMFFRCVLPCQDGMLDPKLVDLYLVTTRLACETFMEAIAIMASGKTNIEKLLKEAEKNK